jgi:hypothetical protein
LSTDVTRPRRVAARSKASSTTRRISCDQGRMDRDGTEVGVQAQPAAEGEERLLRPNGRRRIGPLRPAHRPEQDRVGRAEGVDVLRPDRNAVGVDGRAAGEKLGPLDAETEGVTGRIDDPPSGRDDVRPDAVPRDGGDPVGHCVAQGNSSAARCPTNATSTPLISAP